jgi:hypothetical protein
MKIITSNIPPKQYICGNTVGYISEDGWEDSCPIELQNDFRKPIKFTKGKIIRTFNPFFNILINNYIGEIFFKVPRHIQTALLEDAVKSLKRDLILKYGSLYSYELQLLRKRGFKTSNEYSIATAKERGFVSRYDYFNYRAKILGFKNYDEQKIDRIKKRGFKDAKEYKHFLATAKGFKNYSQLCKFNKLKKEQSHAN